MPNREEGLTTQCLASLKKQRAITVAITITIAVAPRHHRSIQEMKTLGSRLSTPESQFLLPGYVFDVQVPITREQSFLHTCILKNQILLTVRATTTIPEPPTRPQHHSFLQQLVDNRQWNAPCRRSDSFMLLPPSPSSAGLAAVSPRLPPGWAVLLSTHPFPGDWERIRMPG